MSLDPLAGAYAPQDPYRQYHGQPEAEQKRQAHIREMGANPIRGAGAIAGGGLSPDVKRRMHGLDYQIERLTKQIYASEELFNQLAVRITPFVRPMPIQEMEKEARTSDGAQSPLAEQVARLADQLDRINRGMTYLIDGVDA